MWMYTLEPPPVFPLIPSRCLLTHVSNAKIRIWGDSFLRSAWMRNISTYIQDKLNKIAFHFLPFPNGSPFTTTQCHLYRLLKYFYYMPNI